VHALSAAIRGVPRPVLIAGAVTAVGVAGLAATGAFGGDDAATSEGSGPTDDARKGAGRRTDVRTVDSKGQNGLIGLDLRQGDTVVHSVKLEDVRAGERFDVMSELGVTNDLASYTDQPGAKYDNRFGKYRFDVNLDGRVVLADKPGATEGQVIADGGTERVSRENHHDFYTQDGTFTAPDEMHGKDMYVNLVASAEPADAKHIPQNLHNIDRPNMVDLGGKPLLTIDEGHNRTEVVRRPPGSPDPKTYDGSAPSRDFIITNAPTPYSPHEKFVVMSQKVGPLEKGDVIVADGTIHGENRVPAHTLIGGHIELGSSPKELDARQITQHGGFNIPAGVKTGELRHVGAYKVENDAERAWVNYVAMTAAGGGYQDALRVLKDRGGMTVQHYRNGRDQER
jgi:hypothetical protein